jgi:hypothetical protein
MYKKIKSATYSTKLLNDPNFGGNTIDDTPQIALFGPLIKFPGNILHLIKLMLPIIFPLHNLSQLSQLHYLGIVEFGL